MAFVIVPLMATSQISVSNYIGKHYGGHSYDWNNLNQVTIRRNGDTLFYERLVFHVDDKRDLEKPAEFQRIAMILTDAHDVRVLYDSLSYNWPGGPKFFKYDLGDSMKVVFDDPNRVNFSYDPGREYLVEKEALPVFTSVAAVELYLLSVDISTNYVEDIHIADKELRPFRIKMLGEVYFDLNNNFGKVRCYDLALYALDESSVFNSKLYLGTNGEGFMKKESVVNELSNGKRHRSVYNEYRTNERYGLDLSSVRTPTSLDYVKAAFNELSQDGNSEIIIEYLDHALELEHTTYNLLSKLKALCYLEKSQEAVEFVDTFMTDEGMNLSDGYGIGRRISRLGDVGEQIATLIFEKLTERYPDAANPYYGLAIISINNGKIRQARKRLELCLSLAKDETLKSRVRVELEKLN